MNVKRRIANMRSKGSVESFILCIQVSSEYENVDKPCKTHAANKSGRSRYCQYSKFGIGSSKEAGSDSRLCVPSRSPAFIVKTIIHVEIKKIRRGIKFQQQT